MKEEGGGNIITSRVLGIPCAEFLPEFIDVLILGDLFDHVQSLADKLFPDDLQELVLLEGFTTYIQRQVIRVNNTTDEWQVLRHHVFKVVSDEDTTYIQLDLVHFLPVLREEVVRSCLWHIQNRTECHFTFSNKMSLGQRIVTLLNQWKQ